MANRQQDKDHEDAAAGPAFRVAKTFPDSLQKLSRDDRKAVKKAVFDLLLDPPTLRRAHRISKDKGRWWWALRANRDIRLILCKSTSDCTLLCYVGHHDDAYGWAERRRGAPRAEPGHPRSAPRAGQGANAGETPSGGHVPKRARRISRDALSACGVPDNLLDSVQMAMDGLLACLDRLPGKTADDVCAALIEHLPPREAEAPRGGGKAPTGTAPVPRQQPPQTAGTGDVDESCFIVTATYGDCGNDTVIKFRRYRDEVLQQSMPGRLLMRWYARFGPQCARFVTAHPRTRMLLAPLLRFAADHLLPK